MPSLYSLLACVALVATLGHAAPPPKPFKQQAPLKAPLVKYKCTRTRSSPYAADAYQLTYAVLPYNHCHGETVRLPTSTPAKALEMETYCSASLKVTGLDGTEGLHYVADLASHILEHCSDGAYETFYETGRVEGTAWYDNTPHKVVAMTSSGARGCPKKPQALNGCGLPMIRDEE